MKMKIEIGRSKVTLEAEDVLVPGPGEHSLRLFCKAGEEIDFPELVRLAFKPVDENEFRGLWWILNFGAHLPLAPAGRSFDPGTLRARGKNLSKFNPYGDSGARQDGTGVLASALRREKTDFGRLLKLGRARELFAGDKLIVFRAIYETEPEEGLAQLAQAPPAEFWEFFRETVVERFPPVCIKASKKAADLGARDLRAFADQERRRNPLFVQFTQLFCEAIWIEFLARYNRLIFRRLRPALNTWERRVFMLMYSRLSALGGLIAFEEPAKSQIKGLLECHPPDQPETTFFSLALLNTVEKRDRRRQLRQYLEEQLRLYLEALPKHRYMLRDYEHEDNEGKKKNLRFAPELLGKSRAKGRPKRLREGQGAVLFDDRSLGAQVARDPFIEERREDENLLGDQAWLDISAVVSLWDLVEKAGCSGEEIALVLENMEGVPLKDPGARLDISAVAVHKRIKKTLAKIKSAARP